jgi:hypothetical protein
MFIPSIYSGSSFRVNPAADNSCEKHKKLHKKYKKAMWKAKVFTKKRQALEHKANAAHADYLACKEAGGDAEINKLTGKAAHTQGTGLSKSSVGLKAPAEADAAVQADAAAAAAEAEGGGNAPAIAFSVLGLLVVGGGVYFLLNRGKKHKKHKKHGKHDVHAVPAVHK